MFSCLVSALPPRWTEACIVSVDGLNCHCSHKNKQTHLTKGLMFQNACQLLRANTVRVVLCRTGSRSDTVQPPTQSAGSPVQDTCSCCCCVCFSCFCHDTEALKYTCPSIFLHVRTKSRRQQLYFDLLEAVQPPNDPFQYAHKTDFQNMYSHMLKYLLCNALTVNAECLLNSEHKFFSLNNDIDKICRVHTQ